MRPPSAAPQTPQRSRRLNQAPQPDKPLALQDKKIFAAVDGWIHCFREPHVHIPPGMQPRAQVIRQPWQHGTASAPLCARTISPLSSLLDPSRAHLCSLAAGIPRALISQSDFVDPNNGDLKPRNLPKKYLFAYSNLVRQRESLWPFPFPLSLRPPKLRMTCWARLSALQGGDWNEFNRNWTVAKECVKIAAKNGMKLLLVGKKKDLEKVRPAHVHP